MRRTALLLATLVLAGSAMPAAALTHHRTEFDVRFAGVAVGKATFDIRFDREGYQLDLSGRTVGVADLFAPGRGAAESSGKIVEDRVRAERHTVIYHEKKKKRPATLEMTFRDGALDTVKLDPDKRRTKEPPRWVPVTPEQLKAVVDPASGIVIPVPHERATDPRAVCDRVVNIYDGDTRYDIALRYKATKPVETGGYKGWAHVCQLRYVPVSGHRPSQKNVQYMRDNKLMEIWLAPMAATNIFSPIRVEVPTWLGRVVAEPAFFGVVQD